MTIDPEVPDEPAPLIRPGLIPTALFFWPLLYMIKSIVPFGGRYVGIGNDFIGFYYKYKVYLLAHLAEGSFPMWSPAEAAGFPFFSSPLTQAWYPANIVLLGWYKLTGGYDILDHQLFTVVGLSIFAVGLYAWLRLLNANLRGVVFAVLVVSVSFKLTETLRFANSAHSVAWYPWILYGVTRAFTARTLVDTAWASAGMVVACFLLSTSAYPYFAYYFAFLALPYAAALCFRRTRAPLVGDDPVSWRLVGLGVSITGVLVVVTALPYLFTVKNLTGQTLGRHAQGIEFATRHELSVADTLGALVYPPLCQWEGWFFFSITALVLLTWHVARRLAPDGDADGNLVAKMKSTWRAERTPLLVGMLVWAALIIFITWGSNSFLFQALWRWLPGFSSMRVWGRITVILLPPLALVLSWAFADFERMVLQARGRSVLPAFGLVYGVILALQVALHFGFDVDEYWTDLGAPHEPRLRFVMLGAVGFAAVVAVLTAGSRLMGRVQQPGWWFCIGLALVAAGEMWPVGAHLYAYEGRVAPSKIAIQTKAFHDVGFVMPRVEEDIGWMLRPPYGLGIGEAYWYFGSYTTFRKEHAAEKDGAMATLLGKRDGRRVFFTRRLDHDSISSFLADDAELAARGNKVAYNGDVLVWEVDAPASGFLSYIDNWDPHWQVSVDERPAELVRLFGTFKAVAVPAGRHRVEFRYAPTFVRAVFGAP